MEKDLKLYYSIKETSELLDIPESTLRYWEKQFDSLNPRKTQGGSRLYSKNDIELLKLIRHLLKDKGLTIAAAKERLKKTKKEVVDSSEIAELLKRVRDELQAMLDELK